MRVRNIAILGAVGVAGLALIGAGAAATFTANTSSTQTINAGTLSVVVSSPDAPGCTTVADACTSLTLTTPPSVGSTFDTPASVVTLTNVGTIPAYYSTVTATETDNNSAFVDGTSVCDYSIGGDGVGHYVGIDYNGSLSLYVADGVQDISGTGPEYVIQPGYTDSYSVDFYAGTITDACGSESTSSLPTAAQGGSLTFTLSYGFTG